MKIVFGIIVSNALLKDIWIKCIKKFKTTQNKDLIDFYFLYSENNVPDLTKEDILKRTDDSGNKLFYDFYSETENESTMASFTRRSISMLTYLDNTTYGLPTYFIRTDITTLFNFAQLIKWLDNKPTELFFGGSIVNKITSTNTFLSGTNLIFSKDISKFLIKHQNNISSDLINLGDDLAISNIIIKNLHVNLSSVKRIDFTPTTINYHKCVPYDKNIFCFRFNTSDTQLMDKFNDLLGNHDFDLNKFIQSTNLQITTQYPEYDILSDNIFKLSP